MLRFRKFVSRGRALGRELVRGGSLGVYLGGDLVVDMAPVLAVAGRLLLIFKDLVALHLLPDISSFPRAQNFGLKGIDAEAPPAFIRVRLVVGWALYEDPAATRDDLREAVTTLESVATSWKRVFGETHPETQGVQTMLGIAREKLARALASSGAAS